MKRFIFVTFAFLAAAFYQLSGGADFQPRVATFEQAAAIEVNQTRTTRLSDPVKAASLIAQPAILSTPAPIKPTPAVFVPSDKPASTKTDQNAIAALPSPLKQPLVLASLEQGLAGLTTAAPVATKPEPVAVVVPPADIREIAATRVNMRDGPGTTYPILTRLSLGHEVEVLDSPGNGWLRLRTLSGDQVGWISASLVSKAAR